MDACLASLLSVHLFFFGFFFLPLKHHHRHLNNCCWSNNRKLFDGQKGIPFCEKLCQPTEERPKYSLNIVLENCTYRILKKWKSESLLHFQRKYRSWGFEQKKCGRFCGKNAGKGQNYPQRYNRKSSLQMTFWFGLIFNKIPTLFYVFLMIPLLFSHIFCALCDFFRFMRESNEMWKKFLRWD